MDKKKLSLKKKKLEFTRDKKDKTIIDIKNLSINNSFYTPIRSLKCLPYYNYVVIAVATAIKEVLKMKINKFKISYVFKLVNLIKGVIKIT